MIIFSDRIIHNSDAINGWPELDALIARTHTTPRAKEIVLSFILSFLLELILVSFNEVSKPTCHDLLCFKRVVLLIGLVVALIDMPQYARCYM